LSLSVWRVVPLEPPPDLPRDGKLRARIHAPIPCGVRWDRLLARELGCSRSRVARALRAGTLSLLPAAKASAWVRDGQVLEGRLVRGRPVTPPDG
jgi:hypothetical protein